MSTLFLESYVNASKSVKLEDLLESMLDFQIELNTFNESVLVADYQLSLREDADEAKTGFFARIGAFIAKLWKALKNKISQIIAWIATRIGLNYVNSHSLTKGRYDRAVAFNNFLGELTIDKVFKQPIDELRFKLDKIKSMDLGGPLVDGSKFSSILKSIEERMKAIQNGADAFYKEFEEKVEKNDFEGAQKGSIKVKGMNVSIAEIKNFLNILSKASTAVISVSKVVPAEENSKKADVPAA
jgi:hypothetical protein